MPSVLPMQMIASNGRKSTGKASMLATLASLQPRSRQTAIAPGEISIEVTARPRSSRKRVYPGAAAKIEDTPGQRFEGMSFDATARRFEVSRCRRNALRLTIVANELVRMALAAPMIEVDPAPQVHWRIANQRVGGGRRREPAITPSSSVSAASPSAPAVSVAIHERGCAGHARRASAPRAQTTVPIAHAIVRRIQIVIDIRSSAAEGRAEAISDLHHTCRVSLNEAVTQCMILLDG